MDHLSSVHTFVRSPSPSGRPQARLACRGCRLRPGAWVQLLRSNFKESIEGWLMIMSQPGAGPDSGLECHQDTGAWGSQAASWSQAHWPAHLPVNSHGATVPRLPLVPIGMGSRLELMPVGMGTVYCLALAYAFWHGLGQYEAICNSSKIVSVYGRTYGHRGSSCIVHHLLLSVQDGWLQAAERALLGHKKVESWLCKHTRSTGRA